LSYNNTTGTFSYTTPNSDGITEGSTNLYFTNARARSAVSATGSLSYNSSTGVFSYTQPTNVSAFTNDSGYLTGITGAQVTTALGYTPYNSTNPSGYITSSALSSYLPLSGGTVSGAITAREFLPGQSASTYSWNGSSMSFYWTKIANLSGSDGHASLLIHVKTDVNYIPYVSALLSLSKWNSSTISVKLDGLTSVDMNILVRVDNNNDVWLWSNAEWSSFKTWAVISRFGSITLYSSSFTETLTTPANSVEISIGQQVRGNQGAMASATVSNNSAHTFGSVSSRGAITQGGNQVLHAGNYSSYAPSLTGSGASGTWGISISGNAATATSADQIDGWGFVNTGSNSSVNADTIGSNGISYYTAGVPNFSGNSTDGALYSQAYNSSWQHQIAADYRSGQIALRGKNSGTWQSWRTVLDSSNYTSYSPSLTGSGASGTWGISITGAAPWGSVSGRPGWLSGGSYIETQSNANSQVNSGFYENGGSGSNWPSATWYNSINVRHSNQGNYHGFQIAMSYYDNNFWFRSYQGSGTFQSWVQALSTANYSSYALPLSGGTISGAIRASQITAGGSTNTDANLGVQGTSHLTGTIHYGGTVGNVSSWSSISTSSSGTHTFSASRFVFDRYGYGSQPLLSLESGAITLSQPTYAVSGITANSNGSGAGIGINLYSGSPSQPTYGLFFAQTGNFGTYGAVSADWATYFTMNSTANRGWIFREIESLGNVAAISNQGNMTLRSHFEQGNNIARPNVSWSAGSTSNGMVIFYLPGTTANYGMIHMVFDIYEYNGNAVSTVIVGGHNWSTSWYNTGANVIGSCGKEVRLGVKDGRFCVVFGTSGSVWEYGTIVLRKIHNGSFYDNVMDMVGNWSAAQTTTESFTSITGDLRALRTSASFNAVGAITQNGNQVLHAGNYTSYSPSLGGTGATGTWGINITGSANTVTNLNSAIQILSGGGGATFGANHYSMGKDIANGSWSHPHYSDLIIGYHTGIRLGAAYSGIRFYANSPTTDANNDGNGDQGEALLMTVGGYALGGSVNIVNDCYAYGYRGHSNVAGTGQASYHPAGIYSVGTNWLYGTIIMNGNGISGCGSINGSTPIHAGNYSSYALPLSGGTMSGAIRTVENTGIFIGSGVTTSNALRINFHTDGDLNYMIGKRAGAWTQPMDVSFYTGIRYHAHQAYGGHKFYSTGYDSTYSFSVGDGDSNVRVYNNLYVSGDSRGTDVYTTGGWFRNHTNNNGIYWSNTAWHLYPSNANDFYIRSGSTESSLSFLKSDGGNLGYVHFAADLACGFLTNGRSWRFRVDNSGNARCYNNLYLDQNYGHGHVGLYDSYRYQGVFFMGDAYKMSANGTTLDNMYGIGWSHPNAGGAAGNLTDHGMLIINNGSFRCAISNSIVASGNITAYSDERLKRNWRDMPENFVERLAQVRVGCYERIDDGTQQVGVSAQSLQPLLPEAIQIAKDEIGTLSVSYGNAAMASAVELAKELVMLKKELAEIKSRLH
jgi:hypothetical protein